MKIQELQLASRLEVEQDSLQQLLEGNADEKLALKLGFPQAHIQNFLEGIATEEGAQKLGLDQETLQLLLNKLGPKGIIGFMVASLLKVH